MSGAWSDQDLRPVETTGGFHMGPVPSGRGLSLSDLSILHPALDCQGHRGSPNFHALRARKSAPPLASSAGRCAIPDKLGPTVWTSFRQRKENINV